MLLSIVNNRLKMTFNPNFIFVVVGINPRDKILTKPFYVHS